MQRLTFLGWLLCCLTFYPAISQNRQVSFESASNSIEVTDSRVDHDSNVISVGYQFNMGAGVNHRAPVAIKTTRSGKIIWTRQLGSDDPTDYSFASNVRVAANGDYLIGGYHHSLWPLIWRLTPSGTNVYAYWFGIYGGTTNKAISLTELPNGHIALCFNHDFSGTTYVNQGCLLHLDSAGVGRNLNGNGMGYALHTYGENDRGVGTPETTINDVVRFGNNLYFVGAYKRPVYGGGIVIRTDTNGNHPLFYLATGIQTRGITVSMSAFTNVRVKNGRLFLAGSYFDTSGSMGYLIGTLDTQAKTLTGVEILTPRHHLYNPRFEIADTGNWYYAVQPHPTATSNNFQTHTIFAGRFSNGTLVQNRRIFMDSAIKLSAVNVVGDTVICSGTSKMGSKTTGFLCSYNMAASANVLCNVSDTTIQASSCSLSLSVTFEPDGARTHSPFPQWPVISPCIYEVQRCGPPCASQNFNSSVSNLSPTNICPGDTLQLVKNGPCMRTTWYRDSVRLGRLTDTLTLIADSAAAASGNYYVITYDGACSDTSNKIAIRLFPVPKIEQHGDTLFSTIGLSYQWFDSSGVSINGATEAFLTNLTANSKYYVQVIDSNGCAERSAPYFYQGGLGVAISNTTPARIRVYPNPVINTFSIRHVAGKISRLYLTDLKGREVASWEQPGQIISLADYQLYPGVYVLTAVGRGFTEHVRLMVNMP